MPRKKEIPPAPADEESFEQALEGLERIVEAMEHESLPLEELVAAYEKGTGLLRRCETILRGARERIELITVRHDEEIVLESAAGTAHGARPTDPSDAPTDDSDTDDDIRLF